MSKAEEFKDYEELIKNIPEKDYMWLAIMLLLFATNMKDFGKEMKEHENEQFREDQGNEH